MHQWAPTYLYDLKLLLTHTNPIHIYHKNKGKESGSSYQKLKRPQWTGTQTHMETKFKYFDEHGRLSQSEESQCM